MKAAQVVSFGGPEVLEIAQVPDPIAGPGEAVVEISIADVLAIDAALRSGTGREYFGIEPPFVPGTGVGGEVVSVGDGVGDDWIGCRVVALTGISGGYAERAVVPEKELIPVPNGLGLDTATALINDGRAALALVEGVGIRPGGFRRGRDPWRVRCLEVRGHAEAMGTSDGTIVRIHPERIVSFGIDDPDREPHDPKQIDRNVSAAPHANARGREVESL